MQRGRKSLHTITDWKDLRGAERENRLAIDQVMRGVKSADHSSTKGAGCTDTDADGMTNPERGCQVQSSWCSDYGRVQEAQFLVSQINHFFRCTLVVILYYDEN